MYLVLAQLFALFHFASSVAIPQNRRDGSMKSSGGARFEARHVGGHNDIAPRGTIETSEPATNQDGWYSCIVGVGDQSFTLQFDSGSSDLWISGALYQPNAVSAELTDWTWSQTYGQGQAQGVVYTDTVTLGSIGIENQPVEVATEEASTFESPGYDGIIGLALGSNGISQPNVPTFLDSIYSLQVLESQVYTAKLTRPNENVGFYTFGYIDEPTLGGQTPLYTPLVPTGPGFWAFPSTTANIGGNSISIPDNIAIADTGTTLILLGSDTVLNEIYNQVGGSCNTTGLGATPCIFPQNADIPSITLYIGDYPVTLDPQDFAVAAAGEGYEDYYLGAVQPSTAGFDIFGDLLLINIYAIFDFGNEQFGFVPRTPGT